MTVIDQLNKYVPSTINKTLEVYKSIFGDSEAVREPDIVDSADYKCGAIANELEYAVGFCEYITRTGLIDNYYGEYLDRIVFFFIGISRTPAEDDASFRNRFKALVQRAGNVSWITKWSILDVFSYFFTRDILFLVENFIDNTKIVDPDFEDGSASWVMAAAGSSTIARESSAEAFSRGYSINFNVDSAGSLLSLRQNIVVDAGEHMLSFWIHDDTLCSATDIAKVSIRRSGDNYYYNFDTYVWQAAATYKYIPKTLTGAYRIQQMFVKTSDTRTLTVSIENSEEASAAYEFWVDLVEFGVRFAYPTLKLIIVSKGENVNSIGMWQGTADPVGGLDYTLASYIGQSSLAGYTSVGVVDYYEKLLNMIRPAGVYSEIEIINRYV